MKLIVLNQKTNEKFIANKQEIKKQFENDTFCGKNLLKSEIEEFLENFETEEEKQEFLNECKNSTIYEDEAEYLKEMVEYETYTSNTGIESVYKVIEIING